MTVSICMCTYQGERFVEKQLLSLYEQTVKPDEVIICDDGSADRTTGIIREFIEKRDLKDRWHLICNPSRLGFLGNFYHACGLCTGDVVFFADQDDLWHPEKIEKTLEVFHAKPQAKVVCCKFGLIDESDRKISSVAAPVRSGESASITALGIGNVFRKCEWPAMVLAFKRDWYLTWRKLTEGSEIPHDYLFCAKAAEEEGFFQLDLELAGHRLHGGNVAKEEHKTSKLLKKGRKLEEIDEYLRFLHAFKREEVLSTDKGRRALERKLEIMSARRDALISGKLHKVITNRMKYGSEIRMATFICDVLIVKQKVR